MARLHQTLDGAGAISIKDGYLGFVELFHHEVGAEEPYRKSDHASAEFELSGDRAHFGKLDAVGGAIGLSGSGNLFYDGRLRVCWLPIARDRPWVLRFSGCRNAP